MSTQYLFNYSGKPWLAQKWSRAILDRYYGDTPYHGWEGDEDEGQMGAWYVMSAMGFFEMDGGCSSEPMLEIGSPIFGRITVKLNRDYYSGNTFTVETRNNSPENIYIQKAFLNGKQLKEPRIPFSAIKEGGKLVLEMGPEPSYSCFPDCR